MSEKAAPVKSLRQAEDERLKKKLALMTPEQREQYYEGKEKADELGYRSPPTKDHENRDLRLGENATLVGFDLVDTSDIQWNEKHKQSRSKGVQSQNLTTLKNTISEEGQKFPVYCTVDPVSGKLMLEHGHHRWLVCDELGIKIAIWIIEFIPRPDGLDSRDEFNQEHNKAPARKGHDKDDALHYLNKVKTKPNYFDEQYKIEDEEKRESALRDRANELLRNHYSHLSKRTRGAVITKWLNGIVQSKINNSPAKAVKNTFTTNNWVRAFNSYDFLTNELCYMIQMGKESNYVGSVEDLLRLEYRKALKEIENPESTLGMTPKNIEDHFKKTKIIVVAYTTSGKNEEHLDKTRKGFLEQMRLINEDTLISPNTIIAEVLFAPQLLSPVEENKPIEYTWNSSKNWFIQKT